MILRKKLESIIKNRDLQKFAFRLYGLLADMVKCVDMETYRLFTTINLKMSKDWDTTFFNDVSKEDQIIVREAGNEFSEVSL